MVRIEKEQMRQIEHLFDGIEDSMVIACMQGYMGDAFTDRMPDPQVGLIVSGEYSFFGGDPKSPAALEMVKNLFNVNESDMTVAIFSEDRPEWEAVLMSVSENSPEAVPRFGIAQKDYDFDKGLLQSFIDAIPEGYELVPFDENLYDQAMEEDWSREFCETFASAEDFLARGFGFAAVKDGKLVSGSSTMTVYDGGTELQVATHMDHRQKGLALPCSAAMVLECTNRGIRPCWDAANLISKKMALKLGYEYKGEYMTIHMRRGPEF